MPHAAGIETTNHAARIRIGDVLFSFVTIMDAPLPALFNVLLEAGCSRSRANTSVTLDARGDWQ
jgi:hypothetical protein